MKTQSDTIRILLTHMQRIIHKHSFLEDHPIRFAKDIVLTPREIHTIQAIGEHPEINIKELGELFGVSKSAASQMTAKLVGKGYVCKENPIDNNKELRLSLTDAGRQAFHAHACFHGKHLAELEKCLKSEFSDSETARTAELLAIIENVMDKRISTLTREG